MKNHFTLLFKSFVSLLALSANAAEYTPLCECTPIEKIELKPVERIGSIILAGGQGTRLGYAGPKGLFPIAGKTLFQWLLEKAPHKDIPIAIMTSPLNHEETVAYFKDNQFFDLDIHFFQQEMRPFLNAQKQPMECSGPNGNGNVFYSFVRAGLADLFASKGVDLLTISYIDNPLSDPFDPALVSHARETNADIIIKCLQKQEADPAMGMLVKKEDHIEIVEYMELDPTLDYQFAYCGQMAIDLSFFCRMAEQELPIHWVQKKIDTESNAPIGWKGELFIFDVLPYTSKTKSIYAPRATCFAPVKSLENVPVVEKLLKPVL